MDRLSLLQSLENKLIVSCQSFPGEALYGADVMARFAIAAVQGGAVGIRANSPQDIRAIRAAVDVPVIGLWKREYADSEIYITPVWNDVEQVIAAGAHIVAIDATKRRRPGGESLASIVERSRTAYPHVLLMADVSTLEEGLEAVKTGFDMISTTLSGYTAYSPKREGPDFELVSELTSRSSIPVFAEGRIQTPEHAKRALACGAYAVVIGTVITRPHLITEKFVRKMESFTEAKVEQGGFKQG